MLRFFGRFSLALHPLIEILNRLLYGRERLDDELPQYQRKNLGRDNFIPVLNKS